MSTPKTPVLNSRGLFSVSSPFVLAPNTLYTCKAIRSFADLIDMGVDPFATYYQPQGLDQAAYKADVAAGANIITLMADANPTIHIPDTYIAAYPEMGTVAYNEVVLAFSFGPLPDFLDLTGVKQALAERATEVIGKAPTVTEFVSPSTGAMTQAQSDAAEIARQAAITDGTSTYAKYQAALAQITLLQEQIAAMTTILTANGLITETAPSS